MGKKSDAKDASFDGDIKAIPTVYRGIQLKSRMEAQCAVLFDKLGWEWEYEKFSLMLPSGVAFIPDFWFPWNDTVVECRGYESPKGLRQIEGFARLVEGPDGFQVPDKRWDVNDFLVIGPESVIHYTSARFGSCSQDLAVRHPFNFRPTVIMLCGCGWNFCHHDSLFCFDCNSYSIACITISVDRGKVFVNGFPVDVFDFPVHPNPIPKPEYLPTASHLNVLKYDLDGSPLA